MAGGRAYRLTRGGVVLAILRPGGHPRFSEYPCIEGDYETTPAFEEVRPLFEREAALLDVDQEPENTEWLEIWEELKAPGLFIQPMRGEARLDILWIHIVEDRCWWMPLFNSPLTQDAEKLL